MHLQRRGVDEESRTDEFIVHLVIAQNVADILAQETLDAFTEFLNAVDVFLIHEPSAVSIIRLARLELFDGLLDAKIPRDIRDQIANLRESPHRFDRDWLR